MKFKNQLMLEFFAVVNYLVMLCDLIGGFRSILRVSVCQDSLLVIIIIIEGSEKRNCKGDF